MKKYKITSKQLAMDAAKWADRLSTYEVRALTLSAYMRMMKLKKSDVEMNLRIR